ncbi:MAG: hypothetical protein V7L25_12325 [Nostoc sp.]|uniref:hypothetical protein n=1 Tax=Nostoc sp. TaxID=1180 RepID=UPI002FF0CB38
MLNETISIYAIIDELLKAMPAASYAYAHQEDLGLIDCSSVRSHPHMEIWGNSVDEATCNPGCDRHPTIRTLQIATNTQR